MGINRTIILVGFLGLAMVGNFVGAFRAETGFDALWYHLTLPKLYLLKGEIYHVAGGLLYYSEMPRLGEMLYLVLMGWWGSLGAHLVNFAAGVGSTVLTYKIARKFAERDWSLLAAVIFYLTPLVGWLSGSGYIDLPRTFFEALAVYLLLSRRFFWAGMALGLAISTKTLALGSLGLLGTWAFFLAGWKKAAVVVVTASVVAVPWFLSAYLNTGYPFYPLGAGILDATHALKFNPVTLVSDYFRLWLTPDLINPVYLILPMLLFFRGRHQLGFYVVGSYLVWWLIPRTGGGRFILPYLPVWATLTAILISKMGRYRTMVVTAVLLFAAFSFVYRAAANFRTLSRSLCQNLDFSTRVFADCDGWFSKNIKATDLVYVVGVHNLYYVDFPFVHESWWRGERFDYTLVQGDGIGKGELVYENKETKVRVYKNI